MKLRKFAFAPLIVAVLTIFSAVPSASAQTLVYGRGNDSDTLDPAMAANGEDIKLADWIYDGLTRFDGPTTKVVPALAESWEIAQDGLSWTFKLREDVKFHDGTPFTAEAVKQSFERQFIPDHPYKSTRFLRWKSKFGAMTGADVVDAHTIKLNFSIPQPALLYNLAIYTGFIVNPESLKDGAEAISEKPVGTGPFKFSRWVKKDLIELVRNEAYWGEVPKVEKLIVRVIPENDVRLLALQKGEIHLTDDVPFNRITDLDATAEIDVETVPAVAFSGFNLNAESPKLQDVRVRKAIQMAINRQRLYNIMFFKLGEFDQQLMPSGEIGRSDKSVVYPYDPEGAKKLLVEAGVTEPLKIDLISFNNPRPYFPSPSDGAAVVKADLARVGIDANVVLTTWADWLERRRAGAFDMTVGGWFASTVDPEGMMFPLYHSQFVGGDNTARLRSPEVDKLIDEARATYDNEKRQELYARAMDIIADEAITIFLAHPVYSLGKRAEVQGVYRNPANQVYLNATTLK